MVVVDRPCLLTGDPLGGDDPFRRRHVRELRVPRRAERNHVADRGNARHVGPEQRVDLDVALFDLQADAFRVQPGGHRAAAGRDQQIIGANLLGRPVGELDVDVDAVGVRLGAGDPGAGVARDALLAERLLELDGDRLVLDRHQPRQQLDDRHVAAEAVEDRSELDPDGAAAHDHQDFWHLAQADRLVAGDDPLAVDLDPRHAARRRPGGDDDLLARAQRLLLALEDLDAEVAGQPRRPFDPVDLVLLEQELDPLGQAGDDAILPRLHLGHVDRHGGRVSQRDAPVLGVLHHLEGVRVLEQRLGRDAPPQQAGAAQRLLFFDHGGLETELRGADRRHVPAGPGADYDHVIFLGHGMSRLSLQRREGDEVRRRRLSRRLGRMLVEFEAVHACTHLPVLIPQFPVGFRQAFEAPALASRHEQRDTSQNQGRAGQQPMKGQQPWYVIERLATVSTA